MCFFYIKFDESWILWNLLFLGLLRWWCDFHSSFFNMVYHIDWFVHTEPSLHPWNKPTWSWCMIFLHIVEFSLLTFCWGFLHLYSEIQAYNLIFLSFFDWFYYQGHGGLRMNYGNVSLSSIFWKSLRRISISSSLFGRIPLWGSLVLDFGSLGFFWVRNHC